MTDFLFRGALADLDPALAELIGLEAERQYRKLILIPSESTAPLAVREALASAFQNIYAEGYPDEATRRMSEAEILDYPARLADYRRYSDPRYYKGVEYADLVEALARRRCAEIFTANGISADQIFVNVQPLSGAPANNAVYHALINPGETMMGMDLLHGGHLTHGSPVNRSGKYYQAVSYSVDPQTERIDYAAVEELAHQHKPRFIIAGYTSYPWAPDWAEFRRIADSVDAYLFADISHVAGLVVAGVYPSPLGFADVISFTTHKSLCGPRGAVILTTRPDLARKIDRAVFPGEQGGPHVHALAAMAVTFRLAGSEQFRQLQAQIVKNAVALGGRLQQRGLRLAYGGTDTHLLVLDCKTIVGPDGTPLYGDQAARILDLVGLVANRNTIPGDPSAGSASGVRLGTPWVTQRGLRESDMGLIGEIIADVLTACTPFSLEGRKGELQRTRVDFSVLEEARLSVRQLAQKAGIDFEPGDHGYPHFYYLDDYPDGKKGEVTFALSGEHILSFLSYALTSAVDALQPGQSQPTRLFTSQGEVNGTLRQIDNHCFHLTVPAGTSAGLTAAWLRDLSDGFVRFDVDLARKLPGPNVVSQVSGIDLPAASGEALGVTKPFFIGIEKIEPPKLPALPRFSWVEQESPLRRTPIFETHRALGARMIPFAGWEMPVWYTSVIEEHQAVRQAAGLFDVSHMGVYQAEGRQAALFLDSVVGNDVGALEAGESLYTHFLDPEANVIDDLLVYRRAAEKFLVVVNASNDDKDWAWLNAVRDGDVLVDVHRPWACAFGSQVLLRNLRDRTAGADMRVDIALQGPLSRDVLLALGCDQETRLRIMSLARTRLCEAVVGGFDLVVSRTGYTGEKMAFELFVHPDKAQALFKSLLQVGEPFGLKPCGLGARDSLRTEAGLPLYGHEMGGEKSLGVGEAGFGSYVKLHKPWFIGRQAFVEREAARKGVVARFRFNEKGVRMAHLGDPVIDKRGRTVGFVTSCAIDRDGFLTGQAYVELKSAEEGASLFIFQSAPATSGKAPADLVVGDRVNLPTSATVLSRFPK